MPKEIIRDPLYACTICTRQYPSFKEAEKCEKRPVKTFRFQKYQVVTYKNGEGKFPAVIHSAGGEEEHVDPHEDPKYYYAYAKLKFLEPTHDGLGLGDLYSHRIFDHKYRAECCPLCGSRNLKNNKDNPYPFIHSTEVLFSIDGVEYTECQVCKTDYFTQPQLEAMLAKANAHLSGVEQLA